MAQFAWLPPNGVETNELIVFFFFFFSEELEEVVDYRGWWRKYSDVLLKEKQNTTVHVNSATSESSVEPQVITAKHTLNYKVKVHIHLLGP